MKLGIVDVGGGTRGIYGAGVLDFCMSNHINADYFIGVSAGAANATSYAADQIGRNYVFYNNYAFRKEYMGFKNWLKTGSYIGLDYIYSTLSNMGGEYPLNYYNITKNPMEIEIVATDALTGKPHYFNKKDLHQDNYDVIKASCCVPVICKPYVIDEIPYFDGGMSDPIPFQRAFEQGCDKLVVILTKPKNFYRKKEADQRYVRWLRRQYPVAAEALNKRSEIYNTSLKQLLLLEEEGKVLIISPDSIGELKTLTKDHEQLNRLYHSGKNDAKQILYYLENL